MRKVATKIMVSMTLAAAGAGAAFACGFDSVMSDRFSAQHAKSLPVAFAIGDAVVAGALDSAALAPIEAGPKGYWRAMARLQRLQQLLTEAAAEGTRFPDIAVLLIDSQLWTRLRAGPSGYEIEAHAAGPAPGDVVIVTNEYVLARIDDGTLDARRALEMGVVAVDGSAAAVTAVREHLLTRIDAAKPADSWRTARKFAPAWGAPVAISGGSR